RAAYPSGHSASIAIVSQKGESPRRCSGASFRGGLLLYRAQVAASEGDVQRFHDLSERLEFSSIADNHECIRAAIPADGGRSREWTAGPLVANHPLQQAGQLGRIRMLEADQSGRAISLARHIDLFE